MKKTPKQERASILAASVPGGKIYAHATLNEEILAAADSSKALSTLPRYEFACTDCGTKVVSSLKAPFCISCGSDHNEMQAASTLPVPKDTQLMAIQCTSCAYCNILNTNAVKAAKGIVHCSCCGEALKAADETVKMTDPKNDPQALHSLEHEEEAQVNVSSKKPKSATADLVDLPDDGDDYESDGSDLELDFENGDPAVAESADSPAPAGEATNLTPDTGTDPDLQSDNGPTLLSASEVEEVEVEDTTADADELPALEDETAAEGDAEEETEEDAAAYDCAEGAPLADALALDDTADDMAFAQVANRLVILKAGVTIAALSRQNAGSNKDIMFEPVFENAVRSSAAKGLRKTLKAFKFSMLNVPTVSKATVQQEVSKVKAAAKAEIAKSNDLFQESLAIAAAGLSRDLWKGSDNPLIKGYAQTLAQAGFRNPKAIAKKVFQDNHSAFLSTLLNVTAQLMTAPTETRKAMAASLEMTNDDPVDEVSSDDQDDVMIDDAMDSADDVSARFAASPRSTPVRSSFVQHAASHDALTQLNTAGITFLNA